MKVHAAINSEQFKGVLTKSFRGETVSDTDSDPEQPGKHKVLQFEDITASAEPFPHCVIRNFIESSDLVDSFQKTLLRLEYFDKNNDLYKFQQTKALEYSKEEKVKEFKQALVTLRDTIGETFGLKLTEKIDMFSAQYNYTDTLLCHDDELEGRRFAYIYYLVDANWSEADGGCLDLFATDTATGLPGEIVKSIVPSRNSLAFFEVTPKSYHQVAEVLSQTKCRHSVTGWFHGPSVPRNPQNRHRIHQELSPSDIDEASFFNWINMDYVDPVTQSEIQEKFEEESEIQLSSFLQDDLYNLMDKEIKSEGIEWMEIGPANKRKFEIAKEDTLPQSIKDCLKLLVSDAMFLMLSNLTGLQLHPLAAGSDDDDEESESEAATSEPKPKKAKKSEATYESSSTEQPTESSALADKPAGKVSYDVRRWKHGSYTLLHDNDSEQGNTCALDATLHFNTEDWDPTFGGFTSYVAKGEDEELLTVEPQKNCLSLVYRDTESLRFVKHVNHRITGLAHPYVYDISLVYQEP